MPCRRVTTYTYRRTRRMNGCCICGSGRTTRQYCGLALCDDTTCMDEFKKFVWQVVIDPSEDQDYWIDVIQALQADDD